MERQELEKAYKLCIEKWVREYRISGKINRELLKEIAQLQEAIRNYDIVEEISKQLAESAKHYIINHDYKKDNFLEEIPIDKFINPFPISDDYIINLNINKISNDYPAAAEHNQHMAAKPEFNSIQDIENFLATMTSQKAGELTQDTAAKPEFDSIQYIEDFLATMTSPKAGELTQDTTAQPNGGYHPNNR